MEVTLEDIHVFFVESPNGPAGSGEAFNKLEAHLPSLKGRRFYGTYHYSSGVYRACVALEADDDPGQTGLQTWRIPGGKYARQKLENWTEHADEIPDVFEKLSKDYAERVDSSRPSIEFYRSQKELICLLPIL